MDEQTFIARCLNGDQTPDCDRCPYHYTKGGQCCFGLRHEYNDSQCNACILQNDCAALSHPTTNPGSRPLYPGVRTIARPGQPVRVQVGGYQSGLQPGPYGAPQIPQHIGRPSLPVLNLPPALPNPVEFAARGMVRNAAQHALWGALEGAFTFLVQWLQTKRPRPM